MREILFRVWNGANYEYDVMVGKFGAFYVNPMNGGLDVDDYASLSPFNTKFSDNVVIEQFTGLHDATKWEDLTDAERDEWIESGHTKEDWKGRRIFEGDVVLVENFRKGVVRYLEKEALFAVDFSSNLSRLGDTTSEYLEIIGNIHNNKELLS